MLTILMWIGAVLVPGFLLGAALGIVWQLAKFLAFLVSSGWRAAVGAAPVKEDPSPQ